MSPDRLMVGRKGKGWASDEREGPQVVLGAGGQAGH